MYIRNRLFVLLAIASLSAGCVGTGHQLPEFSEADRATALRDIAAAPELQPTSRTTLENELIAREVLGRVQLAAGPLCAEAGQTNCWYTLQYSPAATVNATIADNIMIFYDGLAQLLENEDEFAAIISHEVGHHIANHYEETVQNRAVGSIVAQVIFGGIAGATGAYQYNPYQYQYDLYAAKQLGASIGDISFSKEQETEADYIAAYLMTRAGYNPEAANEVWVKLAKASGRTETALLDTHPAGPDRLATWRNSVEEVRYSADLLPNPVGSGGEAPLQVARSFSHVTPLRSGLAVAAAARPSAATTAHSRAPSTAPVRALAAGDNISGTRWVGEGSSEACGKPWAMRLAVSGQDVSGTLRWSGVEYDLVGQLEAGGQMQEAIAAKSSDFAHSIGPRFFEIDLDFGPVRAQGRFGIKMYTRLSCGTEVTLSKL